MKVNKSIVISLVLLIIVAALYRIIPNRPMGFAPHIAMALFGGSIIKDKRWAFALPIFSMFLSDLLYQSLYNAGMSTIPGFYEGQFTNYILFAGITVVGFLIKKIKFVNVFAASLIAPTIYFICSNFMVWINGAGLSRPKTWDGLLLCYADAIPFFKNALFASIFFSAVLFGGYYLLTRKTSRMIALSE